MTELSRQAKEYIRSKDVTESLLLDEQKLTAEFIKATKSTVPYKVESSWVYETFKKKRCSQYIPSKKEPDRCGCGRSKASHRDTTTEIPSKRELGLTEPGQETSAVEWKVSEHTETDGPTDAFGELEFTGAGRASRAKFIRISDDTDPEDVLRLLQEEWKLELPKLVISVTGGAKYFVMHPKLKDLFREGLLKVTKTTGAWIITGGTNAGVNRHVGDAVKGHTVMSRGAMLRDKTSRFPLIGIASWGNVEHRSKLIGKLKGLVTYEMTPNLQIQGSHIDNNHSHFLLVDDGTEGNYGGEIQFRARLQNCLANKEISISGNSQNCQSNGIPVVLVVLEGGSNVIRTVLESVEGNPAVPVVIVDGSGRAADILAYAYSLFIEHEGFDIKDPSQVAENEILKRKIKIALPSISEEEWSECYRNVLQCVKKHSQRITICHMDDDGIDIEKAILKAILKEKSASPSYQFDLAWMWNRADIARTEIFTEDKNWETETLEDKMEDALINNRVEFVDLLLEKGVSMGKFLTTDRLQNLLKAVTGRGLPSRVVFEELIGKFKIERVFSFSDVMDALWAGLWGTQYPQVLDEDPYLVLFLWSVLSNMQKMALFMWERGGKNLACALIAGNVYKLMAMITHRDDSKADVTDEITANFEKFKGLSLDFLDQCFRTNKDCTEDLLTKTWCGRSCLSLAYEIGHEEFLAHVSCQALLTEIWTGHMKASQYSALKTISGLLFPPAIFSLEFEFFTSVPALPSHGKDYPVKEENTGREKGNIFTATSDSSKEFQKVQGRMTRRQKMKEFYTAPVTKFWVNVLAYNVFLALFSYVILVRQATIPSNVETVLIVFVCSFFTEEIRQILEGTFKEWSSSKWNILDGLAAVSFFVGFALKLHQPTSGVGHLVYCFDAALWIMRLLSFFSINKRMGPIVVMIYRMAEDLMYFLVIVAVFLLAYGITQQAILYPNEPSSWSILSRIFFRPYFQAHGELFLDAPDIIENTTTVFGTPRKDGYGDTVVSFMTAIYLIVVNLLLLNVIIAQFSNSYETVKANWKFERYSLVMEYKRKPVLPPPFIMLNHMYSAIMFFYRLCCCKGENRSRNQGIVYNDNLKLFEERCMDDLLRQKTLLQATQEEKIRVIGDSHRVDSFSGQLRDITWSLRKVERDLSKLCDYGNYPTWRPSQMASFEGGIDVKRTDGRLSPLPILHMRTEKVSGEHPTHVRARQSPYLKSSQARFVVPDFLVAWQESFPGYDPPQYTARKIQKAPVTEADPDIMDPTNKSLVIKFNSDEDMINRRSHCGEIEVVDRLPRNPVGRTGITGRGLFGRWGPNHAAYLIITRWKMDANKTIVQKKGKQVLEFVTLKSRTFGRKTNELDLEIPGGMIEAYDSVSRTLIKSLRERTIPCLKPTIAEGTLETRVRKIIETSEEVYKGYLDDPRNTDNAWMETVTMNFHDETRETLGDFEFEEKTGVDYSVNWQDVSSQINLQANHSFILHKVAMINDAYF